MDTGAENPGNVPKLRRSTAAMRELDAMVWRDGIAFSSYGVRIGIRISAAGFAPALERFLPSDRKATTASVDHLFSLVVGTGGTSQSNALYAGAESLGQSSDLSLVLKLLEAEIRRTVAERASRRVFVHAGAVGWRGRAIILPGASLSGKSTLVAELVRLGARYYSDEYAIIDENGFVHPFARPISLRKPDSFEGVEHRIEDLGGTVGTSAIPIGIVAQTHFVVEGRWRPQVLTQGQGLLSLISHSIAMRRNPARVARILALALGQAIVVKGARGEASDAARALIAIAEGPSARVDQHPIL